MTKKSTFRPMAAAISIASTLSFTLVACSGEPEAAPTVTETVTETVTKTVTETVTPKPEKPASKPAPVPEPGTGTDAPVDDAPELSPGQSPTSQRGNLIKTMGEKAGLLGADGQPYVTFTVHSITEGTCTEPMSEPPENGYYMFLDVSMETAPDLLDNYGSEFDLTYGWSVVTPDGNTSNAALDSFGAFTCLPSSRMLPGFVGPGQSARGIIVLDTPTPSGILVFQDILEPTGWEWEYPG